MRTSFLKILFVLLIFSSISTAQEKNENLTLIESFAQKPNCGLLLRQLDLLMVEVFNKPQSLGYVVIYGGENPIENIVWERAVRNYIRWRRFDPNRISVLTAKSNQSLKINAFVATNGAKPNVEEEKFSYVLPDKKPILFADDAVSMVKIDKKDDYLTAGCEACCLGPLDFNILAAFLEANPRMNVEIRIFNKSKKKADKLVKLITEDTKDYKISPARLKIKYSGKGKRDTSDSSDISDVETWLISQEKN